MLPDHKIILDFFGPTGWRLAHFARSLLWRVLRPKRLAAAAIVRNQEGHVLLVENSYCSGWRLPGGGIEAHETAAEALTRELQEEVNLTPHVPRLHGICLQNLFGASIQLLVYVVEGFDGQPKADGVEILRILWADPAALPEKTEAGAARRIAEVVASAACAPRW